MGCRTKSLRIKNSGTARNSSYLFTSQSNYPKSVFLSSPNPYSLITNHAKRQIWFFHPICELFGLATHQVPFPSWRTMLPQITLFFIFEDIWHYFAHQALHYGPLYKRIHKLHHKYSAPFGLAAEYAHPVETFTLGAGTIGGPLVYCWLTGNLHILTMYIWVTLRLFQAIDAHSGYGVLI